jgi:PTH1 family peptidyl-tRNA hydrolase
MPDSKYKIIAGLGNPGKEYARTRHNIGFLVLDVLALKSCTTFDKTRFDSEYVKARIRGKEAFLIKPLTYMNRSGLSIHKFAAYYKIESRDIIIVHDDMDLDFGKIKIVKSRGHGGHNGVRSIMEAFGSNDHIRVRVGVGHPSSGRDITGHVLGGFSPDEIPLLDKTTDTASNACLHILENGVISAMNTFNQTSNP